MKIGDTTSLKDVEQQETLSPNIPITTGDGATFTLVYPSKPTMLGLSGHPILTPC